MRIVTFKQNTPEWEAWRSEPYCVGASDAPAICGVSKYTSPRMIYDQRVNGAESNISEYIRERGHHFERRAHAMLEFKNDIEYERDVCAENSEYPNIRASFDGINHDLKRFQEIKYVGAEHFNTVREGGMLDHYRPQLAHQAFVSQYPVCDFTVYNEQADDIANIEVHLPFDYIRSVMKEVFSFVERVRTRRPPPLTHLDVLSVEDDQDLKVVFHKLLAAKSGGEKERLERYRKVITEKMPHTKIECLGVRVTKTANGRTVFRFPKPPSQTIGDTP